MMQYLWTPVMIRLKGLYLITCTRTLQPESTEIKDGATVQMQSHSSHRWTKITLSFLESYMCYYYGDDWVGKTMMARFIERLQWAGKG